MNAKAKAVVRAAKANGVKTAQSVFKSQIESFLRITANLKQSGTSKDIRGAVGALRYHINASQQVEWDDPAIGEMFRNSANQALTALSNAARIVDRREHTPAYWTLWRRFESDMQEAISVL